MALQISVAQGEALPLEQDQLKLTGHAIEARIYAEDPADDFRPDSGVIELWRPPSGDGIRVDDGVESGQEISPFYDAMVAKIIAWGTTRDSARSRLLAALHDTALFGPASNRDYLITVLQDEGFAAGEATTDFVGTFSGSSGESDAQAAFNRMAVAAVVNFRESTRTHRKTSVRVSPELLNWGSCGFLKSRLLFDTPKGVEALWVQADFKGWRVEHGDESDETACIIAVNEDDGTVAELEIDGHRKIVIYHKERGDNTWISLEGVSDVFKTWTAAAAESRASAGDGRVTAPMHGVVQESSLSEGDHVSRGQSLLTIEAMKMQHQIRAPISGTITAVHYEEGEQIAAGDPLVEIESAEKQETEDA